MTVVDITLPHHRYGITIEPGVIDRLGQIAHTLCPHARCALVTDHTVGDLHGSRAGKSLGAAGYHVLVHTVDPGEARKNLDTIREIYDALLDARLERRSPIIALGGGVIGDMAGFAAATYLRGVPFIQCPTTLLAMVDASVGGKTGVNVPHGKNLIGAFHQPHAVVIDPRVLQTLPPREVRCGMAECVKHGVIRDPSLFDFIDEHLDAIMKLEDQAMVDLLARNVRIKANVVMADEREAGERAHLNFGHTFAHAIESIVGYGEIEHGEAVSLGMVAAATLAASESLCDAELPHQIARLLERIGLPTKTALPPTEQLMDAMMLDKKVASDRIRLVLPTRMGEVTIIDTVPPDRIAWAWGMIRE